MYRTLLARCEYGVRSHCKRNVPHVARNVWLSDFQMFVLFEVVINEPTFPRSHTLQQRAVHCLAMGTNSLLTRCKQRAVRYLAMSTNSLFAACREKKQGRTEKIFRRACRKNIILYFCHRKPANTNKKTVSHLRYRHPVCIEGVFIFSYFLII